MGKRIHLNEAQLKQIIKEAVINAIDNLGVDSENDESQSVLKMQLSDPEVYDILKKNFEKFNLNDVRIPKFDGSDSWMIIRNPQDFEKVLDIFHKQGLGNVDIEIYPDAENWFDVIKIVDPAFEKKRGEFGDKKNGFIKAYGASD